MNWIPLHAMIVLDDYVRENLPIIFSNLEGNGKDSTGKFWVARIIEQASTPSGLGTFVELYSIDFQGDYMRVKDQIVRYLRWLKTEVYPQYHVR